MKNRSITLFLMFALAITLILGCSSLKRTFTFAEIKKGNHLDKAQEINLDTFMIYWIEKTVELPNTGSTFSEIYKDSTFTYFYKRPLKLQKLYKIENRALELVDYKSINGDSIREKFYDQIIPAEDKLKETFNKCTTFSVSTDFKYKFHKTENAIEISCRYKINCELLAQLMNKNYAAKYDISKDVFTINHTR